jgi:hypothetical protein
MELVKAPEMVLARWLVAGSLEVDYSLEADWPRAQGKAWMTLHEMMLARQKKVL